MEANRQSGVGVSMPKMRQDEGEDIGDISLRVHSAVGKFGNGEVGL